MLIPPNSRYYYRFVKLGTLGWGFYYIWLAHKHVNALMCMVITHLLGCPLSAWGDALDGRYAANQDSLPLTIDRRIDNVVHYGFWGPMLFPYTIRSVSFWLRFTSGVHEFTFASSCCPASNSMASLRGEKWFRPAFPISFCTFVDVCDFFCSCEYS